jgi:transcriptional regulator with XRE-family HTH domain
MKDLKDRIRHVLNKSKLNQKELASIMNVTEGYVSAILNGRKNKLSEETAKTITNTLGYNDKWLMYGKGRMTHAKMHLDELIKSLENGEFTTEQIDLIIKIQELHDTKVQTVSKFADELNLSSPESSVKKMLRAGFRATFEFARRRGIEFTDDKELIKITEKIKEDVKNNEELASMFTEAGFTVRKTKRVVDEAMDEIIDELFPEQST